MKDEKITYESYSEYIDENEAEIVNDFCAKIKKDKIGDLDLNEYSRFRFWKHHCASTLEYFYKKFLKDTKAPELGFDVFCELSWQTMGSMTPDELAPSIMEAKGLEVAKA